MCGFGGVFSIGNKLDWVEGCLHEMGRRISQRGPDGTGCLLDRSKGLGFVHARLKIIGSEKEGLQPIRSSTGRFKMVFNGEIYNYIELNERLRNVGEAVSDSDTRALLAHIERFGLFETLELLDGMFSFACWDSWNETLTLVRDPFGEKPLYYADLGTDLVFGSTIDVINCHPAWKGEINHDSLAALFRFNYIPGPETIYSGVLHVNAGTAVIIRKTTSTFEISEQSFWEPVAVARQSRQEAEMLESSNPLAFEDLFQKSVALRLRADVEVGSLLSGGIDSSCVALMAQRLLSSRLKTFSLGFDRPGYDETLEAQKFADFIGSEHTTFKVADSDVVAVVTSLNNHYDQPFADASQIPTALISEFIKPSLKVVLGGDGGDELFGGYNRYLWNPIFHKIVARSPKLFLNILMHFLKKIAPDKIDLILNTIIRRNRSTGFRAGEKIKKSIELLEGQSEFGIYENSMCFWLNESPLLQRHQPAISRLFERRYADLAPFSYSERMMLLDTIYYLGYDILVKTDRASMAFGLELRSPFLSKDLFQYAWGLPLASKVRLSSTKTPIRSWLNSQVPLELTKRPKQGFSVPIGQFLRADLRDWAETLLSESSLASSNVFNTRAVRKVWLDHVSGRANHQYDLWSVLMFQSWRLEKCGGQI